jgi:hypothetical protein
MIAYFVRFEVLSAVLNPLHLTHYCLFSYGGPRPALPPDSPGPFPRLFCEIMVLSTQLLELAELDISNSSDNLMATFNLLTVVRENSMTPRGGTELVIEMPCDCLERHVVASISAGIHICGRIRSCYLLGTVPYGNSQQALDQV